MDLETREEWVDMITKEQMPIFGNTAGKLASLSSDAHASSAEVAQVVLADPTMTTRVLQVTNTVYYNPTGAKINTVSRAVVILGFEKLHAICVSVSIIDSLFKGNKRSRLVEEVAKSLHAAIQAKSFVDLMNQGPVEETFISALLYHLGEMAFWCFGGEYADKLLEETKKSVGTQAEIEQEVLGFTLKELTEDLVDRWQLGDTLKQALDDRDGAMPWVECIQLGHEVVSALDNGWDTPEVEDVVNRVAKRVEMMPHQVHSIIKRNAEEALRQADIFKVDNAKQYITTFEPVRDVDDEHERDEIDLNHYPVPDEKVQLDILRDLSELMNNNPDINLVLNLVLEGLHRGVGLDRVMVAFPSKDKKFLAAKFILECVHTDLKDIFYFTLSEAPAKLFFEVMKTQDIVWVGNPDFRDLNAKLCNELTRPLGCNTFFSAPVIYQGRSIGVFYADRRISGRDLDDPAFRGFQHFVREGNKAIDIINSAGG